MQQDARLLKAFRKAKGLTQEALAVEWGVSVRTILRWESGFGRPQLWMRREMSRAGIAAFCPSTAALKSLIDSSRAPVILHTPDLNAIATTAEQNAAHIQRWGSDAVGVNHCARLNPEFRALIEAQGGIRHLVNNGLMSMLGYYLDPAATAGGYLPLDMYLEVQVIRRPDDEPLVIAMARDRRPDEPNGPLMPFLLDA